MSVAATVHDNTPLRREPHNQNPVETLPGGRSVKRCGPAVSSRTSSPTTRPRTGAPGPLFGSAADQQNQAAIQRSTAEQSASRSAQAPTPNVGETLQGLENRAEREAAVRDTIAQLEAVISQKDRLFTETRLSFEVSARQGADENEELRGADVSRIRMD